MELFSMANPQLHARFYHYIVYINYNQKMFIHVVLTTIIAKRVGSQRYPQGAIYRQVNVCPDEMFFTIAD
jgi:hypothetical protein